MSSTRPKLPLHQRLVFRFALMMAVMMLLFDALAETIDGAVFRAFGVPAAFVVSEPMAVGGMLGPEGGIMVGEGYRLPESFTIEGGVLTLEDGSTLPPPNPLLLEALELPENTEIVEPEEAARIQRRMRQVANVTSWSTTALVALLIGVILSRLVTRRLDYLTTALDDFGTGMSDESTVSSLPPLPAVLTRGRDEISQLAAVFAASRERIAELLGTLARRDRTRREWIAHVSHDLRTPLTALSACLDRAEEIQAAGSSEQESELVEVLAAARSDCERLHELTDDLLALARLEASEQFTPEPLLAAELAGRAQSSLLQLARSQGISLELDTGTADRGTLCFDGDGRGILRVLENLLRNAIQHAEGRVVLRVRRNANDASRPGSGDLPRHDASPELSISSGPGDQILFEVLDDGAGFHASTQKPETSSGIGLRVARRFIELHGGRLETGDWSGGGRAAFSLPSSAPGQVQPD